MAKKNYAALANTEMVNARANKAAEIEQKRLELKKEIEKHMVQYAKATGDRKYATRKYRVGKAPNDWKPSETLKLK